MDDDDSHSSNDSFRLLIDKNIGFTLFYFNWCPTMDLLALINNKFEISTQRAGSGSSWNRLLNLSSSNNSISSILSWRIPDGKAIACGYDDGSISLYDVETGTELFSILFHTSKVEYLTWSCKKRNEKQSTIIDSYITNNINNNCFNNRSKLLPNKSLIMIDDSEEFNSHKMDYKSLTLSDDIFPILCSVSKENAILSAFGNFRIGEISILSPLLSNVSHFIMASLSSDFNCISLITKNIESKNEISLFILDCNILSKHKNELYNIALESFHISILFQQSSLVQNKMIEEWKKCLKSFYSKFDVYNDLLKNEGSNSSLEDDLIFFLSSGILNPVLERFLCNSIKLKEMIRMSKSIDNACNILRERIEYLELTIESLIFRLGELKGLSKSEKYNKIGLHSNLISNVLDNSAGYICILHKLKSQITLFQKQLQVFFQWITKAQFSIQENEEQVQWKPINNSTIDESILLEFIDGQMKNQIIEEILNIRESTTLYNTPTYNISLPFKQNKDLSLEQAFLSISKECDNIFDMPSKECSKSFKLIGKWDLSYQINEDNNIYKDFFFQNIFDTTLNEDIQILSFIQRNNESDNIWIIKYNTNQENNNFTIQSSQLLFPNIKIIEHAAYTNFSFFIIAERNNNDIEYLLSLHNYMDDEFINHNIKQVNIESSNINEIEEYERIRILQNKPTSFAVSEGRGVVAIFSNPSKITIFDVEDDEFEEEEEEEEVEEENEENED